MRLFDGRVEPLAEGDLVAHLVLEGLHLNEEATGADIVEMVELTRE